MVVHNMRYHIRVVAVVDQEQRLETNTRDTTRLVTVVLRATADAVVRG